MRATIGGENYLFYNNNGYFDIITNNSIYRITNKGKISKIKIKKDLVNRFKDLMVTLLTMFLTDYHKKKI